MTDDSVPTILNFATPANNTAQLSRRRVYLVRLALPIIVLFLIVRAWDLNIFGEHNDSKDVMSQQLEQEMLAVQTRVLVGFTAYVRDNKAALVPYGLKEAELNANVSKMYREWTQHSEQKHLQHTKVVSPGMLLCQMIGAHYLGLSDLVSEIKTELEEAKANNSAPITPEFERVQSIVYRVMDSPTENSSPPVVTDEEAALLQKGLGWFGNLLLLKTSQSSPALQSQIDEPAKYLFMKTVVGLFFGIALGGLSVILFFVYIWAFRSKRTTWRFEQAGPLRDYLLEIFCLYLLAMYGGSFLIEKGLGDLKKDYIIPANIVMVMSMLLLLFWPCLSGIRFAQVRKTIGAAFGGPVETLKSLLLGPITYLAGWTVLFSVLCCYTYVISKLNIDVSKGAHPIVPLLLQPGNTKTLIMIGILAVVIAPIVEEIMFRGVLYSWLRSFLGAKSSILLSGLLFASIHPQGVVGLVPLTTIGIVLAFVREWRQSLITCMVVHGCFNGGTLLMLLLFFKD